MKATGEAPDWGMSILTGFLFSARARGAESIVNVKEVESLIMLLPCRSACDLHLSGATNCWFASQKRSILEASNIP